MEFADGRHFASERLRSRVCAGFLWAVRLVLIHSDSTFGIIGDFSSLLGRAVIFHRLNPELVKAKQISGGIYLWILSRWGDLLRQE